MYAIVYKIQYLLCCCEKLLTNTSKSSNEDNSWYLNGIVDYSCCYQSKELHLIYCSESISYVIYIRVNHHPDIHLNENILSWGGKIYICTAL